MTSFFRFLGALLLAAMATGATALAQERSVVAASSDLRWAASWAAAAQDQAQLPAPVGAATPPSPEIASLSGRTWRQALQPTLGGKQVRVRFSNFFGKAPLHIAAASLAGATGGPAVSPASLRRLRFDGRSEVSIPPGQDRWSDALRFDVDPAQRLAVSFHVVDAAPFATIHYLPAGLAWSVPGNAVMNSNWRNPRPSASNHVVTGLDVLAAPDARVVVAFGDSITEGVGSKDREAVPTRYPDRLAARLRPVSGDPGRFSVINAGISGNRLLADVVGPKGLARFDRDVLWQSGVTHVVILIGINDIGFSLPEGGAPAAGLPSADQITMGLQQLIQRARDKGVKVLLGTLLPFRGAGYWSEEKEARRQAVNRWIRSRTDVDAIVDFDAVMRNPGRPDTLSGFYDSGDHLHPGNTGYAAMAGAIDLRELHE